MSRNKDNKKNEPKALVRKGFTQKAGPNSGGSRNHNIESAERHNAKLHYLVNLYINSNFEWDEFLFGKLREMRMSQVEVETVALKIVAIQSRKNRKSA